MSKRFEFRTDGEPDSMETIKSGLAAFLLLACLGACALTAGGAPKAADPPPGTLLITDNAGKEHKVKGYRFTVGTMRLSWLAPPAPVKDKDGSEKKDGPDGNRRPPKAASGPEALVVRDDLKIHFLAGVQSLVLLDRVRSITFDNEKNVMTVKVATTAKPEDDLTLVGTTLYKNINKVTVEAEVDKGEAGVADVSFHGGTLKGGIRSIRFPAPKVEAEKPGRPAVVTAQDRDSKKDHRVSDLQALYQTRSGQQKLLPLLHFKKTLKIDVAKIKKIAVGADDSDDIVWNVTLKDGDSSSLTLLTTVPLDGQMAALVGLVGRAPGGYKLIPLKRVHTIEFDGKETPKEKKKDTDDL